MIVIIWVGREALNELYEGLSNLDTYNILLFQFQININLPLLVINKSEESEYETADEVEHLVLSEDEEEIEESEKLECQTH